MLFSYTLDLDNLDNLTQDQYVKDWYTIKQGYGYAGCGTYLGVVKDGSLYLKHHLTSSCNVDPDFFRELLLEDSSELTEELREELNQALNDCGVSCLDYSVYLIEASSYQVRRINTLAY